MTDDDVQRVARATWEYGVDMDLLGALLLLVLSVLASLVWGAFAKPDVVDMDRLEREHREAEERRRQ